MDSETLLNFQMKECAAKIKEKDVPALFVSSKNDRIVQPATAIAMSEACGLKPSERVELNEKYELVSGTSGVFSAF